MILIGLGANLTSPEHGPPVATLAKALAELEADGLTVLRRSRWYTSAPVPASDQPWYVNGVAAVATGLDPSALLALLHRLEARFGRRRGLRNAARIIDLDLLAYEDRVASGGAGAPELPHPRLHQRAFVLLPLRELVPDWRHPRLGLPLDALIRDLPPDQVARPIEEEEPA